MEQKIENNENSVEIEIKLKNIFLTSFHEFVKFVQVFDQSPFVPNHHQIGEEWYNWWTSYNEWLNIQSRIVCFV